MFFGNANKVNSLFLNEYLINLKNFSSERYINNQFNKEWDDFSNLEVYFIENFSRETKLIMRAYFLMLHQKQEFINA